MRTLVFLCLTIAPVGVMATGPDGPGIGPMWQKSALGMDLSFASHDTGTVYMVAMRDSVRLWTKVFLPDSVPASGLPTLLLRTPYKFIDPEHYYYCVFYEDLGRFFADEGYAFALQDCRQCKTCGREKQARKRKDSCLVRTGGCHPDDHISTWTRRTCSGRDFSCLP